jgi:hypothetical protein
VLFSSHQRKNAFPLFPCWLLAPYIFSHREKEQTRTAALFLALFLFALLATHRTWLNPGYEKNGFTGNAILETVVTTSNPHIMKKHLFYISIAIISFCSCQKRDTPHANRPDPTDQLEGSWRMVSVSDDVANTILTKPSSITGDVDITFARTAPAPGSLTGFTPSNNLFGDYTEGNNKTLSIPAIASTKVAETSWGDLFLLNITHSQRYFFSKDKKLNIVATTGKTLTFKKI